MKMSDALTVAVVILLAFLVIGMLRPTPDKTKELAGLVYVEAQLIRSDISSATLSLRESQDASFETLAVTLTATLAEQTKLLEELQSELTSQTLEFPAKLTQVQFDRRRVKAIEPEKLH